MWHLGTWFSRHGGVGVMVGPDDLRGLFQPKQFYDSVIPPTLRWPCSRFPRESSSQAFKQQNLHRWDGEHRGWRGSGVPPSTEVPLLQQQAVIWGHFEAKVVPGRLPDAAQQWCSRQRCCYLSNSFKETTELPMHPAFTYCCLINIFASDPCWILVPWITQF